MTRWLASIFDEPAGHRCAHRTDAAGTRKADPAAAVDIDVRVNSRDKVVFVRFNTDNAKYGDLKAALDGNSRCSGSIGRRSAKQWCPHGASVGRRRSRRVVRSLRPGPQRSSAGRVGTARAAASPHGIGALRSKYRTASSSVTSAADNASRRTLLRRRKRTVGHGDIGGRPTACSRSRASAAAPDGPGPTRTAVRSTMSLGAVLVPAAFPNNSPRTLVLV